MLDTLIWKEAGPDERRRALARPVETGTADAAAREIVDAVRDRGDEAVRAYAAQLDGYAPESFRVPAAAIRTARARMDAADVEAVKAAADAVRRFHIRQGHADYSVETWPGVTASRRAGPVDVAALYVPAGSAPLVSTLIMLAVPAQLAGVPRIVVVAPPLAERGVDPALLATAEILGLDEIYAIGGAQAIAALATGSAGLPRADKIFGPGNAYVAAAKAYVAGLPGGPAIDLPAGPSEVMVIADDRADAELVASDLLSQAEHDPSAQVILACFDTATRDRVIAATEAQLAELPRADIARAALEQSRTVICDTLEEAAEVANAYAPEHLILQLDAAERLVGMVRHAGSIFVGAFTPEAAGDYAAGPNHTLPTAGPRGPVAASPSRPSRRRPPSCAHRRRGRRPWRRRSNGWRRSKASTPTAPRCACAGSGPGRKRTPARSPVRAPAPAAARPPRPTLPSRSISTARARAGSPPAWAISTTCSNRSPAMAALRSTCRWRAICISTPTTRSRMSA